MNRLIVNDLIDRIAQSAGVDRAKVEQFVNAYFAKVAEALAADGKVEATGLGVFAVEGEEIIFIPEQGIADAVNAPFALFEPVELAEGVTEADLQLPSDEPQAVAEEATEEDAVGEEIVEAPQEQEPVAEEPATPVAPPPFDPAKFTPAEEPEPEEIIAVMSEETAEEPEEEPFETPEDDPDESPEEYYDESPEPRRRGRFWKVAGIILLAVAAYLLGLYTPEIKGLFAGKQGAAEQQEAAAEEPADSIAAEPMPAPVEEPKEVLDTVRVKYYITHMAKRYYGNDCFWSYIYEENRDHLRHPDYTQPGTVVVIPPAEKYGINAADSASVANAKQLGYEIYQRWQ